MLQQPSHSFQQQQQQQRRAYPLPPKLNRPASVLLEPSTAYHAQEKVTRPRSQSQAGYSTYVPPPNISQFSSANSSANSGSGNSNSSANSGLEPGSSTDLQPRLQNWRPPPHKSKLSKQYTPSEDSDEESTGGKAAARRRSKYMSGAALELNTGPRKEETRARTQSNASQTSVLDDTDAVSLNSLRSTTKKLSLGKRISSFFRGSANNNGKSSNSSPVSSLTQSLSNAATAAATEDSINFRSSTPSLTPIDELTPPDHAHSVYIHQRSHSTPDHVGSIGYGHFNSSTQLGSQNSAIEENRLRTARDSGFEEASGRGHRRHSSSVVKGPPAHGTSSPQLQPYQPSLENQRRSYHHHKSEGLCIDSQQQHQHQQIRRPTVHLQLSTSSPQLPPHVDNELHLPTSQRHNNRHSFMGTDITNYPSSTASTPKRGNPPTGFASSSSPSDTLISKVDREKASVCFQAPSAKKETFTRDAHLDPALSSLVQQHRKDFKTNQRLGGTPQMTPQRHSPQLPGHSPRQRGSFHLDDPHQVLPPPMLTPGSRRDSSGSQSYVHPSSSPGLYAVDTQTKRLSTSSQYLQQQYPNYPYTGTHGSSSAKPSGSQGSLSLQHPAGLHFDQGLQSSPLVGPQKTSSSKRLSTIGYFTPHQHQQQFQLQPQPTLLQISPFPSPSLGALPTTGPLHEMTTLQPTLLQQQQLEQLQQIRIQQQQVLLQQQQHLHQQAQQTRAVVAVTAAAALQQQQQQQQQQLAQVGLGLDMMPARALGAVGHGAVAMTAISPGAVSPLALSPAVVQTPHTLTMHQYQQQQRSTKINTNDILHGTVPIQTYPAGTGYR